MKRLTDPKKLDLVLGFLGLTAAILLVCLAGLLYSTKGNNEASLNIFSAVMVIILSAWVIASHIQQEKAADEEADKRAEQLTLQNRTLTIINNLTDAIISTDPDGVIRVYNAASLSLLDTNRGLNGRHVSDAVLLYEADDKPFDLFKALKSTMRTIVREDIILKLDGESLRIELSYSPVHGAFKAGHRTGGEGYVIIMRDITKAKSLEEERDEFISVVSHELRTPITIAEGTISNALVMMDRPKISENIMKKAVAVAHEQVVFLAKMVNDLSTLSRAERGIADAPELIDVTDLVHELYKEYAPQAEKKGLHFNLDMGTRIGAVNASRLYIHELLQNFITNAIKYTKEGGITLSANVKNGRMVFTVEDTGIGIGKSDLAKIFNKFYRAEDYRIRETSGTGLGLYVASKLAKKLGTSITVDSRLNHGSSFCFSLPVKN